MDMYTTLLKQGWTLTQIDEMDILFYFELLRHANNKTQRTQVNALDQMGL